MSEGKIERAYIVPGLPHLVLGAREGGWDDLRRALRTAGERVRLFAPDVLVLYSTQWISVLGHSFQIHPHPKGLHVDENWHEMGNFPFDFRVDTELGTRAAAIAASRGLATKTVSYEGFPIDTGTLVALHFFNPASTLPVSLVSCNIYAGREDSLTLGQALGQAIRESGRRAVLIACTALSARFFTTDIQPSEDRIGRPEDEVWNRRVLDLIRQGKNSEVVEIGPRYAEEAGVDMGFKAFYWLMGALGVPTVAGEVLAYGPLWGTGAAVVEYDLA